MWLWTARHPEWDSADDWPQAVMQCCYCTDEVLVLFDPLIPPGDETQYWEFLERRRGHPALRACILLSAPWHERSAATVARRLRATVWAHPAGFDRLTLQPTAADLPAGVQSVEPAGIDEGEVAFYIAANGTLIVAEFFLGESGALRVMPSPAIKDMGAFLRFLSELAEMPIDRVLVAHGEPVLTDGNDRIREALPRFDG